RSHDSAGFFAVRTGHHLEQGCGNDLPRDAVLVLQPAALLRPFVAAFAQYVPVTIDFSLRLASHHKRNCLGELEVRSTVERGKFLALEAKAHGHRRSLRPAVNLEPFLAITGDNSHS